MKTIDILERRTAMKLEEIKTFVEEHKKEILIGTGVVVGGIVLVVTGKKLLRPRKAIISKPYKDLPKPNMSVGKLDDFWEDSCGKMALVNDIAIKDLGTVGQDFLKVDGFTNDTGVSLLIGFADED